MNVIGRVIERLREHFFPKDPLMPPDAAFPYPGIGMKDFLEWSLFRGWLDGSVSTVPKVVL